MIIPFTKAHGAKNDFLLTWADQVSTIEDLPAAARAICSRHTGVGADGWLLVTAESIRLFNADGSEPELSGNGTRCAAAFLVDAGLAGEEVRLQTGAGLKTLRLMDRQETKFEFEMNMGPARIQPEHLRFPLEAAGRTWDTTILDVGNPQCAIFVDTFPADWERVAAEVHRHSMFPQRTNVSFVTPYVPPDRETIVVLFYERGVGVTMSSGTGSTGAAAAALRRGMVESPVSIETPAGAMELREEGEDLYLIGPAEIIARGEFFWHEQ